MLLWLRVLGVGLLATGLSGQETEPVELPPADGEKGFEPTVAYSPPSTQTFFTPSGELAPPPPFEVLTAPGTEEYAPSIDNFVEAVRAPPPAPVTGYGPPGYAPPPPLSAPPPPPPSTPPPPSSQPVSFPTVYAPPPPAPATGYGPPGYAPPPPLSAPPVQQPVPSQLAYAPISPSPLAPYATASQTYAPPPPPPPSPPPAPAATYGTPKADVLESLDDGPAPTHSRHRIFPSGGSAVTGDYPHHGNFRFSYLTPEGTSRTEIGEARSLHRGEPPVVVVRGSYSWVAPDGTNVRVQYNADENGYTARTI